MISLDLCQQGEKMSKNPGDTITLSKHGKLGSNRPGSLEEMERLRMNFPRRLVACGYYVPTVFRWESPSPSPAPLRTVLALLTQTVLTFS